MSVCWGLVGGEGTKVEEGKMGSDEAARPEGWNEGITKEETGCGPVLGQVLRTSKSGLHHSDPGTAVRPGPHRGAEDSAQPSSGTEARGDDGEGFPP